jgi:hypothetical protein
MKIAHVINVAQLAELQKASYLHIAQPVTMKSMVAARSKAGVGLDVELVAVRHKDEKVDVPREFIWARDINKYAWEHIGGLENVFPRKPLPRLQDIISSLYGTSNAEYYVYTNVDIGLYPNFYLNVQDLIEKGYDAFCINRRELPKVHDGILIDETKLELAYSLDGTEHPGIDCFVFKREIVPALKLGNVYIGYPPVGLVLKTQIERNSARFKWLKDERLTFHLGSDRAWKKAGDPYWDTNVSEAKLLDNES